MRIFLSILIFLIFFGVVYFFQGGVLNLFPQSGKIEKAVQEVRTELSVEETQKEISTPQPLRAEKESPEAFLTQSGIITLTNIQRKSFGLPSLSENERLDLAAALKAQDTFEKQYFAHVSPTGQNVEDLAEIVGYEFIAIGENLALGNFADDKTVVEGWMASPGHRANILSSRYTEIGVAVVKGIFDGKFTWVAVQEFGLPFSACPEIDTSLQAQIEGNQVQLKGLEKELAEKERELKRTQPKWGSGYSQKVEEYNALVFQYNNLAEATKALVEKYNNQVRAFNVCAGG